MNPIRLAGLVALVILVAAPGARAATLTANKACLGTHDRLVLTGAGFTPNAPVSFGVLVGGQTPSALADRTANQLGVFQYSSAVPNVSSRRRTDTFFAVDRANAANRAAANVLLSRVRVTISGRSRPSSPRRIRATGFTTGRTLYAHIRRKGRGVRNARIGRLSGACKSVSAKRRLFRGLRPGTYRVQFDVARRYKRTRRQRVLFNVRIFRIFHFARHAAVASTGARWEQVR